MQKNYKKWQCLEIGMLSDLGLSGLERVIYWLFLFEFLKYGKMLHFYERKKEGRLGERDGDNERSTLHQQTKLFKVTNLAHMCIKVFQQSLLTKAALLFY